MEFLALLNHMEFLRYHDEQWLAPKRNVSAQGLAQPVFLSSGYAAASMSQPAKVASF